MSSRTDWAWVIVIGVIASLLGLFLGTILVLKGHTWEIVFIMTIAGFLLALFGALEYIGASRGARQAQAVSDQQPPNNQ
jgi:uncharacterized membrane protein HdeD (DUF308 family)